MELNTRNSIMLFPKLNKLIIVIFAIAFILVGLYGYRLFNYVFEENVKKPGSITIPYEASFEQVLDSIRKLDILENEKAFKWVARKKDYPSFIKPGKYVFDTGMNSNELVNMLKAGNQKPITITFNNLRFMEDLAGKVSKYIEPDSAELIAYLDSQAIMNQYNFDKPSFHAMFIPNSYEMYWTTTPEQFVSRMQAEYDRFWNTKRLAKADSLNLTPVQVITLASIVQEETIKPDEKPIVAGLYLNRIRKGMLLQADPTVKFALGDFGIQRVLTKHLQIDSPYNTYKYAGLPPGPINFPEMSSIDAVLNADNNKYLYMCAKEDFSGYHNFARTLRQHNANAERYRQALNESKIYK
ncbi:endolytic transglycosylase MltG [Mangrovibacterium lignilyticum]|uniref:endolytic transglycosylase MltG n=1 Tax=Mangrovibacterium lignilyticum TaxID=2668052 RepID=UPI001EE5F23D|nr:endolytic transglycosylase MltG [Mangrovibacterium lignilyticum]